MRIIDDGRPRTGGESVRDLAVYGLLSAWGVWILVSGLRDRAFHFRISTVEAGSAPYPVTALVLALLTLIPVVLCAQAAVALSKGKWRTAPGRDTEG